MSPRNAESTSFFLDEYEPAGVQLMSPISNPNPNPIQIGIPSIQVGFANLLQRMSSGTARLCMAMAIAVVVSLGGTYVATALSQSDESANLAWPALPMLLVLVGISVTALLSVGVLLRRR